MLGLPRHGRRGAGRIYAEIKVNPTLDLARVSRVYNDRRGRREPRGRRQHACAAASATCAEGSPPGVHDVSDEISGKVRETIRLRLRHWHWSDSTCAATAAAHTRSLARTLSLSPPPTSAGTDDRRRPRIVTAMHSDSSAANVCDTAAQAAPAVPSPNATNHLPVRSAHRGIAAQLSYCACHGRGPLARGRVPVSTAPRAVRADHVTAVK
ncbi:hypothetical protein C8T65DRAFT_90424 [Cerioporus squamosus]|nr:hypothetical protein C8T65DRAFT_90424 [Cerioporus squamosus]